MRINAILLLLGLGALGCGQAPTPQFSPADRDSVMAFWSNPDRYTVSIPDSALENGLWQVRLTVEGSTWLWNFERQKRLASGDEIKTWDKWVTARVARDRWLALQNAQRSNGKVLGKVVPTPDSATPASEPADPGPVPTGLVGLVGNPPPFAKAVVPMQHEVQFDDGKITYVDNIRLSNQRYPSYRYAQGVNSGGVTVKTMPADRLDHLFRLAGVNESDARVMRAVSILEGGFDSINTYDTGFVSVGFIQFACLKEGGGSLGAMLLSYKNSNPDEFQRDFRVFGVDVTPQGLLDVLDLTTGAEITGPEAAQRIIEDKRLIAVFQRAGQKSDAYIAAQIRCARQLYFPADDPLTLSVDGQTLTGKVSDVIKSEAGLATLMDRKVNTGNLSAFTAALNQVAIQVKPKTLGELAKYERDIVDMVRFRKDYLSDTALTRPDVRDGAPLMSRGSLGRKGRGAKPQ